MDILLKAGAIKLEYSVATFTYDGVDKNTSQQVEFRAWLNIDNTNRYKEITYKWKNESLVSSESANFELQENKNANIGQANAKAYWIGPQYEQPIPVKIISMISTTLSTVKYMVISVSIYVRNVFLSVPNTFKNLSINFKIFTTFKNKILLLYYLINSAKIQVF